MHHSGYWIVSKKKKKKYALGRGEGRRGTRREEKVGQPHPPQTYHLLIVCQ